MKITPFTRTTHNKTGESTEEKGSEHNPALPQFEKDGQAILVNYKTEPRTKGDMRLTFSKGAMSPRRKQNYACLDLFKMPAFTTLSLCISYPSLQINDT